MPTYVFYVITEIKFYSYIDEKVNEREQEYLIQTPIKLTSRKIKELFGIHEGNYHDDIIEYAKKQEHYQNYLKKLLDKFPNREYTIQYYIINERVE